ncbi:MAG: hypothetical protein WEB33_06195 [Bacteroidota bacterium]
MNSAVYTRTVSEEEAAEGYFMVLKDHLAFFPVGSSFELARGASSRKSEVESRPCTCRGGDKPHRHYFVRCDGLRAGDRITIRKDAKKPRRYVMQVRSVVAQQEFCG